MPRRPATSYNRYPTDSTGRDYGLRYADDEYESAYSNYTAEEDYGRRNQREADVVYARRSPNMRTEKLRYNDRYDDGYPTRETRQTPDRSPDERRVTGSRSSLREKPPSAQKASRKDEMGPADDDAERWADDFLSRPKYDRREPKARPRPVARYPEDDIDSYDSYDSGDSYEEYTTGSDVDGYSAYRRVLDRDVQPRAQRSRQGYISVDEHEDENDEVHYRRRDEQERHRRRHQEPEGDGYSSVTPSIADSDDFQTVEPTDSDAAFRHHSSRRRDDDYYYSSASSRAVDQAAYQASAPFADRGRRYRDDRTKPHVTGKATRAKGERDTMEESWSSELRSGQESSGWNADPSSSGIPEPVPVDQLKKNRNKSSADSSRIGTPTSKKPQQPVPSDGGAKPSASEAESERRKKDLEEMEAVRRRREALEANRQGGSGLDTNKSTGNTHADPKPTSRESSQSPPSAKRTLDYSGAEESNSQSPHRTYREHVVGDGGNGIRYIVQTTPPPAGANTSAISPQRSRFSPSKPMLDADKGVIKRCVRAIAYGAYIPQSEFKTRIGFLQGDVRRMYCKRHMNINMKGRVFFGIPPTPLFS